MFYLMNIGICISLGVNNWWIPTSYSYTLSRGRSVANPECARGGGVSHILAEKRGVSFTFFQKMHENAIFSPIKGGGGVRRLRPMLDPPLQVTMTEHFCSKYSLLLHWPPQLHLIILGVVLVLLIDAFKWVPVLKNIFCNLFS